MFTITVNQGAASNMKGVVGGHKAAKLDPLRSTKHSNVFSFNGPVTSLFWFPVSALVIVTISRQLFSERSSKNPLCVTAKPQRDMLKTLERPLPPARNDIRYWWLPPPACCHRACLLELYMSISKKANSSTGYEKNLESKMYSHFFTLQDWRKKKKEKGSVSGGFEDNKQQARCNVHPGLMEHGVWYAARRHCDQ